MTQITFNEASAINYVGGRIDTGIHESMAKQAAENIDFGSAVAYKDDNGLTVGKMAIDQITLVFDAALITGNTFASNIKSSDGSTEATTAISEAFDTDNDTTVANIAAAIQANIGVASATVSGTDTIIIVAAAGYSIGSDSEAVTGGASQAGVTKSNASSSGLAGLAEFTLLEPFDENGSQVSKYQTTQAVNVMRKGNMVVNSTTGFDLADSALYYVGYGANAGSFDNAAGDYGISIDVTPYRSASASGIGAVSINKP